MTCHCKSTAQRGLNPELKKTVSKKCPTTTKKLSPNIQKGSQRPKMNPQLPKTLTSKKGSPSSKLPTSKKGPPTSKPTTSSKIETR